MGAAREPNPLVPQVNRAVRLRGGPGQFARRLSRARDQAGGSAAEAPLALLTWVLEHQSRRAEDPAVVEAAASVASGWEGRRSQSRYPLLDLDAAAPHVSEELPHAVEALLGRRGARRVVPGPLAEAGRELASLPSDARWEGVATWMDDPSLVEPRAAMWVGVAAGPVLELAAAGVEPPPRHEWTGSACPVCGGPAQVSVIAEESGELLGGSPRSLVCSRCATWWVFPRATCAACGQQDPQRLPAYVSEDRRWVRVDACDACHGYVKTFDLRERGALAAVPLVDDVVTLTLDLWARDRGLSRPVRSLAGL